MFEFCADHSLPSVYSISWSLNSADCLDAPSHNPLSLCSRVFTDSFPTLPCKKYSSWFCLPTTAIFFAIVGYSDCSTTSVRPNPENMTKVYAAHGWSGVPLFFQVMNDVISFLRPQYLFRLRKIILEWLWVGIRISRFTVKISCIRKMARDWKISSQEALRDYKSCERQHLITEDAIHRGTEGTSRPLWEAPPSSEGPRGCNHQQHDHDWRTTSRRETASWEESCWWVSLRGEKLRCMPDWKRHREHVRRNSVNMNC